jgi:hypothetical protein
MNDFGETDISPRGPHPKLAYFFGGQLASGHRSFESGLQLRNPMINWCFNRGVGLARMIGAGERVRRCVC